MSVVGVDFGNKSCVIAVARARGIDVIANEASRRETPSMVAFNEKLRFVGESASTQRIRNLRGTITNIKQLVGRKFDESFAQKEIANLPYKVVKLDDGSIGIEVCYNEEMETFKPEQVVGMILQHVNQIVEKETQAKIGDLVIAVPGNFTDAQRRSIKLAADVAGLPLIRIMSEGCAAAVQYGLFKRAELPVTEARKVMIVDFGHAKLSATIVDFFSTKMKVVAAAHDASLGGRNFDALLADYFVEQFKEKYKMNINDNVKARARLEEACEKVKKVLSSNAKAPLNIECLMNDRDVSGMVAKDDFKELAKPLFERALLPVKAALEAAKLQPSDLHSIELIGGTSRIPSFQDALQELLGKPLSHTLDKSESIAKGCVLQCALLSPKFKVKEYAVQDAYPYSVKVTWGTIKEDDSIEVEDSAELFAVNNALPCSKVISFSRTTPFAIHAEYSDPAALPEGSDPFIGKFRFKTIPKCEGEDSPKIKVKIRLDTYGCFLVDNAYMVETVIVKEAPVAMDTSDEGTKEKTSTQEKPAESEAANKEAEADNKSEDKPTENSTENKEAETAETPATEKKEDPKPKKTVKRTNIAIESNVPAECPKATVDKFFEKECKMISQDKLIAETAAKKDKVESYVYDMRSKIQDQLRDYIKEADREAQLKVLTETEDWLYGEGEEATKSVYVAKYDELSKLFSDAVHRYNEAQNRPNAASQLNSAIAEYKALANTQDEKYAHISPDDRSSVLNKCTEAEQWLNGSLKTQDALDKTEAPHVSCADILKKRDEVVSFSKGIMNKPKPAPPKEEKKPEETKPEESKSEEAKSTEENKSEEAKTENTDDVPPPPDANNTEPENAGADNMDIEEELD